MLPSQKPQLIRLVPTIFQKWYDTSLLEETILSPANLLTSKEDSATVVTGFTVKIHKKRRGISKYSFEKYTYSIENHPLLHDLKHLVEYCIPDASIEENGFFGTEETAHIMDMLSSMDCFYLDYLMTLAYRLKLILPMTAIHSKRVQASPEYQNFFSKDPKECLSIVLDTVIEIAAEKISSGLNMDTVINKDFLLSCLKIPISTDELFIKIYHTLNIDIETIWEKSDADFLNEEESSIVSSTFYLGILLDKWFFTPLGSYLKLIQPLHFTPCNFKTILNNICSILLMENDVSMELFTPCTYYSLTALCSALIPESQMAEIFPTITKELPYEKILSALLSELKLHSSYMHTGTKIDIIYTFKIYYESDKRYWKILEFPENTTLNTLGQEICITFGFENFDQYSLFILNENRFPVEYCNPKIKNGANHAMSITLRELSLSPKRKIYIVPDFDKKLKLEIEFIKTTQSNPCIVYPRIIRQSNLITREEKMDDIF